MRPGRLDKMLNCDFPNKEERLDILENYYNKAICMDKLKDDFSLEKIEEIKFKALLTLKIVAENAYYYTGADLQSLIYNSFLLSAKRNIKLGIDKQPIITNKDIENAFKEFKRSLADKDIKFYNEIKKTFDKRTEGNNNDDKVKDNFIGRFEDAEKKQKKFLETFNENKQTLI
jgi:SpoVK/Ycf46/Vps4 family AAA+-type ATPase